MDDQRIIALYFERSESAIRETERKYGRLLLHTAKNIVGEEDSREVVNDTYLRAWNTIPPQNPPLFSAFLCRIARGLAIDRWRRMNAVRRQAGLYAGSLEELAGCIPDGGREPLDEEMENRRLCEVLDEWLGTLEAETRILFVRRYYFGEGTRSIAADLGWREEKAKSRLHRARAELKALQVGS